MWCGHAYLSWSPAPEACIHLMQFMVLPWVLAACIALRAETQGGRIDRPSLLIVAIVAMTMLGLAPFTPCAGAMMLAAILGGHAVIIAAYLAMTRAIPWLGANPSR